MLTELNPAKHYKKDGDEEGGSAGGRWECQSETAMFVVSGERDNVKCVNK